MTKLTYTRRDIEALAIRLEQRGRTSGVISDNGHDLIVAARILRIMLSQGMPPTSFAIEANGGER